VHSLKDVPARLLSDELALVAFSPREDPRDAWFHRDGVLLAEASPGTKVATSSLRRQCQLRAMRPDLEVVPLRGNLGTRWRKFEEGQFDAMILAAAGMLRLGWDNRVTERIDPARLLPAIGQGIVGLECRVESEAATLLQAIGDADAAIAARAERSLLETVAGGCVVPLAGYCVRESGQLWLRGRLGEPDGTRLREAQARGDDPVTLGRRVAEELLADGGEDIVRRAKAGAKK
jgi:hydroxymethylbilane synthase